MIKNFVLFCCLLIFWVPQICGQSKPNIIYLYADDLGYGELGCYGQQKIKTPNLDQLAAEGIRFTQHYTSAPVCAPARCMLMTGRHGGHSYIRGNYELGGYEDENEGGQMPLPEGTITIGHLLQKAGYYTGAIGKWGLGMNNTTGNPNEQGFDYFMGYLCQKQAHNYYPTHLWENGKSIPLANSYFSVHPPFDSSRIGEIDFKQFKGEDYGVKHIGDKAVEFIKRHKSDPFFLYVPFTLPHVSLQVPDEELAFYQNQFEDTPYFGGRGYSPHPYPRSAYAAMITYLDKQVGRIMNTLKALGLDQNTLVMFSSDNGATFDVGGVDTEFFNSVAGLRGRKMDVYEGGIREPFIARWPGKIPSGRVSDHLSAQYDLMATLTDLLKIKAPENDGLSFLPTLLGNDRAQKEHEFLYFEYPEKGGQVAIRMGKWKGVKTNLKQNKKAPWQLYNLTVDPFEQKDIARENPSILKQMDAIVQREHRSSHIRDWEFIDPKF